MVGGHNEAERIEGLLHHLLDFPPDDGVEELRALYRDRLQKLRKDSSSERHRDPTVQLLRAHRLTRKRVRQRETAATKLSALDSQLALLHTQVEVARAALDKADDVLAEARLEEEGLRHSLLLPTTPASTTAMLSNGVQDLLAQLDKLPAAAQNGTLESAQADLRAQLERIASAIQAYADPTELAHGDPYCVSVQSETPSEVQSDVVIQTNTKSREPITSGRRGTSPARGARSRSRSNGSASSDDQADQLRHAAQQVGQKQIRGWFATPAAAGKSSG